MTLVPGLAKAQRDLPAPEGLCRGHSLPQETEAAPVLVVGQEVREAAAKYLSFWLQPFYKQEHARRLLNEGEGRALLYRRWVTTPHWDRLLQRARSFASEHVEAEVVRDLIALGEKLLPEEVVPEHLLSEEAWGNLRLSPTARAWPLAVITEHKDLACFPMETWRKAFVEQEALCLQKAVAARLDLLETVEAEGSREELMSGLLEEPLWGWVLNFHGLQGEQDEGFSQVDRLLLVRRTLDLIPQGGPPQYPPA